MVENTKNGEIVHTMIKLPFYFLLKLPFPLLRVEVFTKTIADEIKS